MKGFSTGSSLGERARSSLCKVNEVATEEMSKVIEFAIKDGDVVSS